MECGKPGRFLAPIQISRAAGDPSMLLGLPGLLRVARLLVQSSHVTPTVYLFLGAVAKGTAGCSGAPIPALPALTAVPWWLEIPLSVSHPPDTCRQGHQGTAWGDPRTPHQPELVVFQKRDVVALTKLCFSSTSGGSLSCRWHSGCRDVLKLICLKPGAHRNEAQH